MNKKFLSAILFGALMVTSTGTFVSCKDYDDDIDRIDSELSDLKSQLNALQTKIDAGKYITNVATTANGITITLDDGSSYPITNGKDGLPGAAGAAGAAGDKVEINDKGFFVINGEATEWKAVAKDAATGETVKVKVPTVSESGCWVFYDEKGEAHPTTIKVAPVAAVLNADKSWTLTVFDANGGSQSINVPSAASMLTDLIVLHGTVENPDAKLEYYAYDFTYNGTGKPDRNKWKGPRALPAKDGKLVAGMSNIPVQINPTTVDATGVDFSLVNSKNGYPYAITLSASENKTLQTTATITRAAYGNGMYTMGMKDVYFNADDIAVGNWAYFESQFKSKAANILYAVTTGGTVRSAYTVLVKPVATGKALTKVEIKTGSTSLYAAEGTLLGVENGDADNAACKGVNLGQWYSVVGSNAAALYDMYLSTGSDYVTLYGIEFKNEQGNWQFRITKTPDNITRATFPLVVETVDKTGAYKKTTIWVNQSDILTTGYTYDAISHQLKDVAANKNRFAISLANMKNALGSDNLALWNTKVDLAKTSVVIKDPANNNATVASGSMGGDLKGIKPIIVEKNENDQNNQTVAAKANFVHFQISNTEAAAEAYALNHQYVAHITFKNASSNELTTIKVPFTLTIPAITTLFQLDNNFVVNGEAICYMYEEDSDKATATGKSTFKLNRVFSKFSTNSYNVTLDDKVEVGETNRTSAQLATVGTSAKPTAATAEATYITLRDADTDGTPLRHSTTKLQAGYGQSLKLSIGGKFAGVWGYGNETFDFTVKVLSPIYEGGVKPKTGNAVEIPATELDGYKFGNDDIIGNTYNTAVTYKVLPDLVANTPDWKRVEIAKVVAKSSNVNVFTLKDTVDGWATPTKATGNGSEENPYVDGYFTLNAQNVPATTSTNAITVQVTDIWGYVKPSTINVTITVK